MDLAVGRYPRCQAKLARFVQWLGETAASYGYEFITAKKPGRSFKGRNKKNKKKRQAEQVKKEEQAQEQLLLSSGDQAIRPEQMVDLAKVIVSKSHPPALFPSGICQLAFEVLSERKQSLIWYDDQTNIESLSKCLVSLGETLDILMEGCFNEEELPSASREAEPTPPTEPLESSLESLGISRSANPSAHIEPDKPEASSAGQEKNEKKYVLGGKFDTEILSEETILALYLLIEDFEMLKLFPKKYWSDYLAGRSTLEKAALDTTLLFGTTLDLERSAEAALQNFASPFEIFSEAELEGEDYGASEFLARYHLHNRLADCMNMWWNAKSPEERPKWSDGEEYDFVRAYRFLATMAVSFEPSEEGSLGQSSYRLVPELLDLCVDGSEQEENLSFLNMRGLINDLWFLQLSGHSLPIEDEWSVGIRTMITSGEIEVSLVFNTSSYLAIKELLRERKGQPLSDLFKGVSTGQMSMLAYLRLVPPAESPLTEERRVELNRLHVETTHSANQKWVTHDLLLEFKVERKKQGFKFNTDPKTESFSLYKEHPVLCGLLSFWAQYRTRNAAASLCDAYNTIFTVAYLYNILRRLDEPVNEWPDMEYVINTPHQHKIFPDGVPPSTLAASTRAFYEMMGMFPRTGPVEPVLRLLAEEQGEPPRRISGVGEISVHLQDLDEVRVRESLASLSRELPDVNQLDLAIVQLLAARAGQVGTGLKELSFSHLDLHLACTELVRLLERELLQDELVACRRRPAPSAARHAAAPFAILDIALRAEMAVTKYGDPEAVDVDALDERARNSVLLARAGEGILEKTRDLVSRFLEEHRL